MAGDRNFLAVEPAPAVDGDEVAEQLRDALDRDGDRRWHDGTLALSTYGGSMEEAVDALGAVAERVERATVVHVNDSTTIGSGRYYEVRDGDLEQVDEVEGGERHGVDVIDYFAREYGIDGFR